MHANMTLLTASKQLWTKLRFMCIVHVVQAGPAYTSQYVHCMCIESICFMLQDVLHGFVEPFWIIVEDSDSEYVLHHEFFLLK